jgi:ComF family protein
MVNQWLKYNLFQFIPVQCLACGADTQQQALCVDCQQDLKFNLHSCRQCAEPLTESNAHALCGKCLKQPPEFDLVLSPYLYQAPIDKLVTRFKFHADHNAGQTLARLLAKYLQENMQQRPDCLVPVPLHRARLFQRGFNQAQEISRVLAWQFDLPIENNFCQRQRKTSSQSGLNEKQRRRNIRGAFRVTKKIPYKHVAIVDDVMTTGNTVNELARVLRKAGVETIQVWSVCRAPRQPG